MFEIFFNIQKTLVEIRDLMVKMERHLDDLTLPPNMREWARKLKEDKEDG